MLAPVVPATYNGQMASDLTIDHPGHLIEHQSLFLGILAEADVLSFASTEIAAITGR